MPTNDKKKDIITAKSFSIKDVVYILTIVIGIVSSYYLSKNESSREINELKTRVAVLESKSLTFNKRLNDTNELTNELTNKNETIYQLIIDIVRHSNDNDG